MKKAPITGITGQDGSYLAELLLEKGYEVHGIKRRTSNSTLTGWTTSIRPTVDNRRFSNLHYGDLTDTSNLVRLLSDINPDEVYNLGAQSHVAVSFESPEYTADVDGIGALRLLEGIRFLGMEKSCPSSTRPRPPNSTTWSRRIPEENTPFYPRSPYAVAKLYAYWITVNYHPEPTACMRNGILFNHESKRRGETFVTRKITREMSRIATGLKDCLYLGNGTHSRDWGHARDYVQMQWPMLNRTSRGTS